MKDHYKNPTKGKYERAGAVKLFSLSRKKVSWYLDVRLWTPIYLLILLFSIFISRAIPPKEIDDIVVQESITMEVLEVETTEATVPETTLSVEESDVIALARLADSVADGRSNEVKKAIMWVAINRTEDKRNGYGMPLQEEIAKPKQWQQYDPEGAYLETTLALAKEVYDTWRSRGPRMMPQDMLWFVLNGDGSITVRNQFKAGKNRAEMTFGQ